MSVNLGLGFVHLFSFSILCVFMATLWNRAGRYIFILWFLLSFFFFLPILSRHILDVCHTCAHGVALVQT